MSAYTGTPPTTRMLEDYARDRGSSQQAEWAVTKHESRGARRRLWRRTRRVYLTIDGELDGEAIGTFDSISILLPVPARVRHRARGKVLTHAVAESRARVPTGAVGTGSGSCAPR